MSACRSSSLRKLHVRSSQFASFRYRVTGELLHMSHRAARSVRVILIVAMMLPVGLLPLPTLGAQENDAEFILISAPASYLGVNIRDIDDHAAAMLGLKSTSGVEVIAVDHDAPAGRAGLHLRDVILTVDGQPVKSAQQFRETMRGFPPQKEVALGIMRSGKPMRFVIRLADRAKVQQQAFERHFSPQMPSVGRSFASASMFDGRGPGASPLDDPGSDAGSQNNPLLADNYGAELDPIGPQLASYFGVKDGTGMLVKSVQPGSPAAAGGLQAGDVILRLNDEPLVSPLDWMRGMEAGQGKPAALTIMRNRRVESLTLPPLPRTQAMRRCDSGITV